MIRHQTSASINLLYNIMLSLPGGVILFVRHVSKRTKRGLFAGKRVLSGNNVSKDGGNRY